jgi:1,4-dihydroxy-2-naphthoate octaprenyltransferase
MGSYYLFAKEISLVMTLPAISCGFFSMGVLNVNNIRDIESDRSAGKFSIPVRIGRENAIQYHWFLIFGGLATACIYSVVMFESITQFMFVLSAPLFIKNGLAVGSRPSSELDPYLKQMALTTLFFVLLFGAGLLV